MKKLISLILVGVLSLSMVACGSPATIAAYISAIGAGVTTIVTIEGVDPVIATKIENAFSAAETAVTSFKPGTPSSEVVQILQDLANNLDLIPLGTKDDALIAATINLVDNLVVLVESQGTVTSEVQSEAVYVAWVNSETPPSTVRKHVYHGKQMKSMRQVHGLQHKWEKASK